ncbi:hypothetical protein [Actinomycetospora soli]|uniref:hypothetical protein n=1 Tax=Actinomycetospora soli TaxID=2893887 RepID=UPI001E473C60|nr:hypothetical protein [Actinomycetospora soli]MCD2191245.1 hypothetical protein [Actinomycetospora soli]
MLLVLEPSTASVHALKKLRRRRNSFFDGERASTSGSFVAYRAATWTWERDSSGKRRWRRTWSFSTSELTDALAVISAAHG